MNYAAKTEAGKVLEDVVKEATKKAIDDGVSMQDLVDIFAVSIGASFITMAILASGGLDKEEVAK